MMTSPIIERRRQVTHASRPGSHARYASPRLVAALAMLAAVAAVRAQAQVDPFALPPAITDYAAFSCQALTANGGFIVDSSGVATGATEAGHGNVRSNGDINLNGPTQVRGDATAGPGKQVRLNGGAVVTGLRSSAGAAANCAPIDLAMLRTALLQANDNARIPRTAKNKAALGGADGRAFTLNGNDSIALPAGTYLFSSLTVNGNGVVTLDGEVRILCTGAVSLNGGGRVNAAGDPWRLRLWASGTNVSLNGGTVVRGFVYAPSASATINGGASLTGAVFAKIVNLNAASVLYRSIADESPLAVQLTAPTDAAIVHGCTVSVTGQVTGGQGAVTVAINGASAPVAADGTFTADLTLTGTPPGLIIATATDEAGSSANAQVQVVIAPPSAVLVSPPTGSVVGQRVVRLSGACTDAATVTVDGVVAAVADGAWAVDAFDLGLDGPRLLTLVASNCGGSISTAAGLFVDTTPPAVTIAAPASESSGCVPAGQPQTVSGSFIEVNPATGAGGQPPALRLEMTPAGGALASYTAILAADGRSWSVADVDLGTTDGIATATAIAVDSLGNTARVSRSWRVDATPPVVTITLDGAPFPAAPALLNRSVAPRAEVSDGAASAPPVASLSLDGAPYAAGTQIAAEGEHTLVASATDCAGHSASAQASFRLDLSAPALHLTTPAEDAVLTEGPSGFSGLADADLASALVAGRAATVAADGSFSVTPVPWVEGDNTVAIELTDAAGNTARFARRFTVHSLALRVEILDGGLPIAAGATFLRPIAPIARASDPAASLTVTLNGAPFASGSPIDTTGDYELAATATDSFSRSASASVSFHVDLEAGPSVTIASPADGATVEGPTMAVTGTVSGRTPAVVVNGVTALVDGVGWTAAGVSVEAGVTSTLTAIATDAAGRHAAASVTIFVPAGGPQVLILSPADGGLTNRARTDVVGTVVGGRRSTAGGVVSVSGAPTQVAEDGSFRALDVPLVEGANTIVAVVRDVKDRVGRATVHVTADLTPPTIAILAEGQPIAEGATFTQPFTIHVEVADNLPGVAAPAVRLNGASLPTATASVETSVHDAGGYTVTVSAHDAAGNVTRAERSFSLGGGTCSLAGLDPVNSTRVTQAVISVRGRAENATAVTIRVPAIGQPGGFDSYPARLADGTFLAGDVPLPVIGDNTLQISCTGADGGESSESLIIVRLPDGIGPQLTLTAPSAGALLGADSVAAAGTISDGAATVTVNGVTVMVAPQAEGTGVFARPALPLAEGPNVIAARAIDGVGRSGADRVVVWRDTTAPRVQITSPDARGHIGVAPGAVASIDVSGLIDIDNEPNLTSVVATSLVGSVTATVDPAAGAFLAAGVPLDAALPATQGQTITVTAADTLSHVGSSTVEVFLDATGPALALIAPADLSRYSEASPATTVVTGDAWAREGAQVSVNGATVAPASLVWEAAATDGRRHVAFTASIEMPASDGAFAIVARVTELDGRFAQARRLLSRDTVTPSVVELVPGDGTANVDPDALVMALFSEPVLHASLSAAEGLTLTRLSTGETVAGQIAVASNAVAFVPGAALAPGESYRLRAGAGVTDLVGHTLVAAEATFTVATSPIAAAPSVEAVPDVVCAQDIDVKGNTAPGATVRVRVGDLSFTTTAAADGSFEVNVPLPGNGYQLLRVQALDHAGNASAETVVTLRLDCSAPTVNSAAFDRSAGVVAITFSEAMAPATVELGGAVTVCDAESAATCDGAATLSWTGSGSVLKIALDAAPGAWWRDRAVRVVVRAPAADVTGNLLGSTFQTVFFPAGSGGLAGAFLVGETYDDASGRPLPETHVRLFTSETILPGTASAGVVGAPVAETVSDGRGRFTFAGGVAAGRYALVLEKDGYSRAVRRLALEPGCGAVPFDSRLTPLAPSAGDLDPLAGGMLDAPAGLGLTFAAAAGAVGAAGPLGVRLTPFSDQGLPEPLPLGWTPLAAVEVRLESAAGVLPEGLATPFAAGGVALTLPLPSWVTPDEPLVAVAYQLRTGLWVTLDGPEPIGAGLVRVILPSPGTVAIVRADAGSTQPPLPAAGTGRPLLGAVLPQPLPSLAATLALDPPVVAPTGHARARVIARSADDASLWPSGLAVQAVLEEKLVLSGGGELLEAPFTADLVLYRPQLSSDELGSCALAAAGAATFTVSPSERAAQVLLQTGWEDIRLYPFPEQLERGSVLSPAGGSVASPDGVEVIVPEGALPEQSIVTTHLLSDDELAALPVVSGFTTVAAVRLDLSGHTLTRPATIKLDAPATTPPAVPGDPRLMLAELMTAPSDGDGAFARLAARIARQAGMEGVPERLVASPEPAASELSLDGVVREGVYLMLAAQQPMGFATGFVRGAGGATLAGSRVTAAGLGTADLSRDGGRYSVPVPTGNARPLEAKHPTLDETGTATIATLAPGAIAQLDITVRPVPPAIVPPLVPAEGAVAPVGSQVALTFSERLDPASITAATLTLELANSAGEPTGAFIQGTVSLIGDTVLTLAPSYPLPPGRHFIARFAGGVRDATGTLYEGPVPFEWRFTTDTTIPTGGQVHPEKFHLRIPVDGVAGLFGDDGAIPVGWTVTPEVEGPIAETVQATCSSDTAGGFGRSTLLPCQVGRTPNPPVSIASVIWVKVFSPADQQNPAAHFRLGPFVSPDGRAFVAPPGQATTFTSPDGITVEVPEAAFSQATLVTISTLVPETLGIPTPAGMTLASTINVDFDGQAAESLVLKLPAPATVPDDALVAVGAPVDLPWGRRLRLLAIGGVFIDESGQRYLSNDPSVTPEPAGGTMQGLDFRAMGHGPRATSSSAHALDTSSRRTCATAKSEGLSKCFLQSLLVEFTAKTSASWFWGMGTELSLFSGAVSSELAAQFTVVYNQYADAWVYLPVPLNWSGHYVLPVLNNAPLRIVERDRATGWIVGTKDFDPIAPSTGGFFDAGTLPGERPQRPLLVSAAPFDLVRFRAPAAGASERLRLEVEAKADANGTIRLEGVEEFPLADGTQLAAFDLAPSLPSDPAAPPASPKRGPVVTVCGRDTSWASPQFRGSDEVLLVVTPGDLDAERFDAFELEFDRPLTDLSSALASDVVKLEDLGETTSCVASAGTAKAIAVDLEQPESSRRTHLTIQPAGALPAGHRFRLTLRFSGIKSRATDGTELTYWPEAPTVFEFGTRRVAGEPIGSVEPGLPSLGDSDEARDLLRFGNLVLVGSGAGRIVAFDTTDHSELGKFKRFAIKNGADTQLRAFASDGHNRLFYNALAGSTWSVKALRVEDVRNATTGACSGQPAWAATLPCFAPALGGVKTAYALGTDTDLSASEWLALQAMPAGMPTDMEVLSQDEEGRALDLERFYGAYHPMDGDLDQLAPDAEGIYSIDVTFRSTYARGQSGATEPSLPADTPKPPPLPDWRKGGCAGEPPYDRYQRVTVDNLTTGQSWSFDVENIWPSGGGDGSYHLEGLRARRNDQLRVRYNLRAFGYVALTGSGITVVDLNRFYRLAQPAGTGGGQCERRLASYQGQTIEFPACAYPGGDPANAAGLDGLAMTSALAVHSGTGCTGATCAHGATSIDVYSPLVHIGAVHTASSPSAPGDLRPAGVAGCLRSVKGTAVQLRDVALANDVIWVDRGITGTLAGTFTRAPAFAPKEKPGDLLFLTLGSAGIYVFDVTQRRVDESTLIGHLRVDGHTASRLEVDRERSLLLAGGTDAEGASIIDVWDLRAVNGAPGLEAEPRPSLTVKAPWTTNHLGLDPLGTELLYTWGGARGPLAVPIGAPRFVFSGLYLPEKEDMPANPEQRPHAVERITAGFAPLGVPVRIKPSTDEQQAKQDREADDRAATAALKLRVALPGSFGEQLTARVQSLRVLPETGLLSRDELGGAVALPGGEGWPETDVLVHLHRVGVGKGEPDAGALGDGEAGQLATVFNLYESAETVLLLADPRARHDYHLQHLEGARPNDSIDSDESRACRRCEWPSYLPDPKDGTSDDPAEMQRIKELLAGGPYLRAYLAVDPDAEEPVRQATQKAIDFFKAHEQSYPAPTGVAHVAAWADTVPSPIQVSLAEPVQNAASWSPGEAGTTISLASGDALLSATDFAWSGRMLPVSLDRAYRSSTLGYGALGAAGWHSGLLAHLRENGVTGEVEYRDGSGSVYRFYPRGGETPSDRWDGDPSGSYQVPKGLYLRLKKLGGGQGWQLIGRTHDVARFDAAGRLIALSDRLRQNKPANQQGNTIRYSYDTFGQLTGIEDDLGRRYRLEYYDDPKPESQGGAGPRYGLLKKVSDWVEGSPRTVEYEYDTDRRLTKVKLPDVTTTAPEYLQYAFTGSNRPTIEYRYNPQANVTSEETDTHAILHGKFATLRLEGFEQPGSDVLRARFEYESFTGRVRAVGFPMSDGVNTSGATVAWSIDYPMQPDFVAPTTKVTVRAPWQHEVGYTLDKGRITKAEEAGVEVLAAGDPTPALGAAMPAKALATSFEFDESGRLTRATRADGSIAEYGYSSSSDRLAKGSVTTLTQKAGSAAKGPSSYAQTVTALAYTEDNLIERTTDAEGRAISSGSAPAGGGPTTFGYHAESVLSDSTFDLFGRITESKTRGTTPVLSSLVFDQDKRGKAGAGLLKSITAGGFTQDLTYDERDAVKESSTSFGTSATFVNDQWDRAIEQTSGKSSGALRAVDATIQRAFDAAGRLVRERRKQTGLAGEWVDTRYEYTERDQLKSITQTGLAPAQAGQPLTEGTTTFTFDAFGRPTSTTTPASIVNTVAYTPSGRIASVTTGSSGTRRLGYDELGRLVFATDGDDGRWRGKVDAWARTYEEELPSGALIEREHDAAGGLKREIAYADAAKTSTLAEQKYSITSFGATKRSEQVVSGGGSTAGSMTTEVTFDESGRATTLTTSALGAPARIERLTYQANSGRLASTSDPAGNRAAFTYTSDAPWPDAITSTEVAPQGHAPVEVITLVDHDALGRAVHSIVAGMVVERTLDQAGNVLSIATGGSGRSSFSYDGRGRTLAVDRPEIGASIAYGWDRDGRMLEQRLTKERGGDETTTFAYDTSGRLRERTIPGAPKESFTYNGDDTLATWQTRLTNKAGRQLILALRYDAANRLTYRGPANPEAFTSSTTPEGLAPLDGGDVMSYDPLGRLLSVGKANGPNGTYVDPATLVTFDSFDTRGLPRYEKVGAWPNGARIERTFDSFGNAVSTMLPQGVAGSEAFAGYAASFDVMDRLASAQQLDATGAPVAGSPLGVSLSWGGAGRPCATVTPSVSSFLSYETSSGRLASLSLAAGGAGIGAMTYGWDVPRGLKVSREAVSAGPQAGVLANQGWAASYDAGRRMTSAETGRGAAQNSTLASWSYGYGKADELLLIQERHQGRTDYTTGPLGRPLERSGPAGTVAIGYDTEGRRTGDDRFAYTWDWRGQLVTVDVKAGTHAGERVNYSFDGLGRAQSRTQLGLVPAGGTDGDRPFIAKRSFTWDGQRLAAEAGLNFQDQPIWRYQYAPGARWLDDAPQVRVERDLLGSPRTGAYELIRDEMGSVLAVAETREGQAPHLLARYLTTPFGESHVELGPELVRITFDAGVSEAGSQQQRPVLNESVGGALRVVTTLPLDPTSFAAGIGIEQWQDGAGWAAAVMDDFVIAADASDASHLLILRLAGWPKAVRFRVTLTAALHDGFGRALQLPPEETSGVRVVLDVPTDGQTPPQYAREIEPRSAEDELASTLGDRLPGGQTSTFHGMWTDPVSRLGYARARWYSARDASWLSEDPLGAVDSVNLYSYVAMQPTMVADPMGLGAERDINAFFASEVAAAQMLAAQRGAEALRKHRLNPGIYAMEGSAFRGRLYYFLSQLPLGTREETTSWHPFIGANQMAVDLMAFEREHSNEALAWDIGFSLLGPGKFGKFIGLVGAGLSYAERQQQAAEWAGRARVLRNEQSLGAEGRHVMAQLERMTNEAEDLLESRQATSRVALRYYAAESQGKWWAFFIRGQALQSEVEILLLRASESDSLLAQVKVRPEFFGLIPDFVYTQATGERVILDVTSPRSFTLGKALKYAKEAQDILVDIYHRGRGMTK